MISIALALLGSLQVPDLEMPARMAFASGGHVLLVDRSIHRYAVVEDGPQLAKSLKRPWNAFQGECVGVGAVEEGTLGYLTSAYHLVLHLVGAKTTTLAIPDTCRERVSRCSLVGMGQARSGGINVVFYKGGDNSKGVCLQYRNGAWNALSGLVRDFMDDSRIPQLGESTVSLGGPKRWNHAIPRGAFSTVEEPCLISTTRPSWVCAIASTAGVSTIAGLHMPDGSADVFRIRTKAEVDGSNSVVLKGHRLLYFGEGGTRIFEGTPSREKVSGMHCAEAKRR